MAIDDKISKGDVHFQSMVCDERVRRMDLRNCYIEPTTVNYAYFGDRDEDGFVFSGLQLVLSLDAPIGASDSDIKIHYEGDRCFDLLGDLGVTNPYDLEGRKFFAYMADEYSCVGIVPMSGSQEYMYGRESRVKESLFAYGAEFTVEELVDAIRSDAELGRETQGLEDIDPWTAGTDDFDVDAFLAYETPDKND